MVFVRMYLKHLTCHFNAYLQAPICRSCLQLASHRNDWSLLLRRQTNTCEIPFFNERCMEWNWNQLYIRKLYILGVAPCPVTVTTRTIIYFVGDPNLNLHLPLASLWTHIYSSSLKTMTIPKMPPHLWSPGSKLFPFFFTQKKVRPFHLISNLAEHLLLLRGFWGQMIFSSKWKQQIHKKSAQVRNALGDSWFQIPEIPATSLSDSSSPSSFGRMGRLWDCSLGLEMSGCIIYFQKAANNSISQNVCGLGARGSDTGFKNWAWAQMLECEVLALLYSCNGFQLVLLFPQEDFKKCPKTLQQNVSHRKSHLREQSGRDLLLYQSAVTPRVFQCHMVTL